MTEIEIFRNFRKFWPKIELFVKVWPKSKFLKNLNQNRNIRQFWRKSKFFPKFQQKRNLTKIEIFHKFDQNRNFSKKFLKSTFWKSSKIFTEIEICFDNLSKNVIFENSSKIEIFRNFRRNRKFWKIWPKSKFFENFTKIVIFQ